MGPRSIGVWAGMPVKKRFLFVIGAMLAIFCLMPLADGSSGTAPEIPLVTVTIGSETELSDLYSAGLDIVEADLENGEVLMVMGSYEKAILEEFGYSYRVVIDDVNRPEKKSGTSLLASLSGGSSHWEREDYRNYEDYVSELNQIADQYPDIVELHEFGVTHQGRTILGLEISTALGVKDGRPEHFHEATMHAREWPAGEVAMDLCWYIVENYGTDPQVTDIVENIRTWIIPVLNPDGYIYSRTVENMHRGNMRENPNDTYGVDLNRNQPYWWGGHGNADPGSTTYWGPAPQSEPESQVYLDVWSSRDIIVAISGHTFAEKIYHQPADVDAEIAEMAYTMAQWNGYLPEPSYVTGGSQHNFGYGVFRQLGFSPEYGRVFHPPFEGYPAAGLDTDYAGMLEAGLMKYAIEPVAVSGELIFCEYGALGAFPAEVAGNIALIERGGGWRYQTKAENAEAAGAAAVVIFNNDDPIFHNPTIGSDNTVSIPVITLMEAQGRPLAEALIGGETINAEIVPEYHVRDDYWEVWERNRPAKLYAIEAAAEYACVIEGEVVDRLSGEYLEASMEKVVGPLYAPAAGPYRGEYMEFEHRTSIDTEGPYRWHTTPSKQPWVDTPPFEITATAEGYYPQTFLLAIENYKEEHELDFALQPVLELQGDFALGNKWPVNSMVPFYFVTVDARGEPLDMEDVTVKLFDGDTEIAVMVEGEGPGDIRKGEGPGEYLLDGSTAGLPAGSYDVVVEFDGAEGQQSYRTELVLVEELVVDGPGIIVIPPSGEAEETYSAYSVDESGSLVPAGEVTWSLAEPVTGVEVNAATGEVTVGSSASPGSFTLVAEAGSISGSLEVVLATAGMAAAIGAAEEAIDDLPAVIGLPDAAQVEAARGLVDDALLQGAVEGQIGNIQLLVASEMKLAALEKMEQAAAEAVQAAGSAIASLPAEITLDDQRSIVFAGLMIDLAINLGASEGDIANYEDYLAAAAAWGSLIDGIIANIESAIDDLPAEITRQDDPAVIAARALVTGALDLNVGIEESDIGNIDVLEAAESTISDLLDQLFIRESLHNLTATNHNTSWFLDSSHDRWWSGRTIKRQCFLPLGSFSVSYGSLDSNPRWIEYDISEEGYQYIEGYVGASDARYSTDEHPVKFKIYLDGSVAYETLLEYGRSAQFYRLDVSDADTLMIEWSAEEVADSGYANRVQIVEPMFLLPKEQLFQAISVAEDAISALPAEVGLDDEPALYQVRNLVREVEKLGAEESDIGNIDLLLSAEDALAELYRENYMVQSLFELSPPPPDKVNGWAVFARNKHERWYTYWRTINGVQFLPELGTLSYMYGDVSEPRWVEYDISGRDYTHVKGYAGITDCSPRTDYPISFQIHGDGALIYEAILDHGEYAEFYLLDIQGIDDLRFGYYAPVTDDNSGNRLITVEPRFLLPITTEMLDAIQAAEEAIDELPEALSLLDEPAVDAAREAVNAAFSLGVEKEGRIENLEKLIAAEEAIKGFYHDLYDLESLMELGDPGPENRNNAWFSDFAGYWEVHEDTIRSLNRRFFAPLHFYSASHSPIENQPRWTQWDISSKDYSYLEGYLGISDSSTVMAFPLTFTIYGDDEPVFQAILEYGRDAIFYRLDLEGVDMIKFEWDAAATDDGVANRPCFIEPLFLHSPKAEETLSAAISAIDALPAEIELEDKESILAARVLVGNAIALGADEADITNLGTLVTAEEALAALEAKELTDAIDAAIDAIDSLPGVITPADREAVEEARALVEAALALGASESDITNLSALEAAEADLEQALAVDEAIEAAEEAIGQLPPIITLPARDDVEAARALVDAAFDLGAEPGDISNLDVLLAAESEVEELIDTLFEDDVQVKEWASFFELGDPGTDNRYLLGWFVTYDNTDRWVDWATVNGREFDPLLVYQVRHNNLDDTRWINYDISNMGYESMKGFLGISDHANDYDNPIEITILGDGQVLVQEVVALGQDAIPYELDLTGVEELRLEFSASAGGWCQRLGFVEPLLLRHTLEAALNKAIEAIDALPDIEDVTPGDREDVAEARSLVEQALALGALESDITNLDKLEAIEDKLADMPDVGYGDINGDGVINVEDVIMVMQYILGLIQLDEGQQEAADVNGDEVVNVDDVILIMQRVLGLISKFPVEE